jgi:hypothetical protein
VTVDQAPVVVNVLMPWDTLWSSARGELDKEAEVATARATAVAVATAKATAAANAANFPSSSPAVFQPRASPVESTAPPPPVAVQVRVLDAPELLPGGGVFDGGLPVNISLNDYNYAAVDGNSSIMTTIHYRISDALPAPAYTAYPLVQTDVLENPVFINASADSTNNSQLRPTV